MLPPSRPKDEQTIPATRIWEALPKGSRRRTLAILTEMVSARMAAALPKKEVRHDQ